MDGLEFPTVDVLANSPGARLSLAFALDAPGRVSRLVLIGATLLVWPEHDAFGSPAKGEPLVATNRNLRLIHIPRDRPPSWIHDADTVVVEIERFLATERRIVDAAA